MGLAPSWSLCSLVLAPPWPRLPRFSLSGPCPFLASFALVLILLPRSSSLPPEDEQAGWLKEESLTIYGGDRQRLKA